MIGGNVRGLLNRAELNELRGNIRQGNFNKIIIDMRNSIHALPQNSQQFNAALIPRLEQAVQQSYQLGNLPLRTNYSFDVFALCQLLTREINVREPFVQFELDVTRFTGMQLEFHAVADNLQAISFQLADRRALDLGEMFTQALENYEQAFDMDGRLRSGQRFNRVIQDIFGGSEPGGTFTIPFIFLFNTTQGAGFNDEVFYASLLNRDVEEELGAENLLQYNRRIRTANGNLSRPLRTLHLAGSEVNRQVVLSRLRRSRQGRGNLYSYMFTSYQIQSYKYSDFQFMDLASPSYEYGICTLETFEHIRTNGDIIRSRNSHHTAQDKAMFVREKQIQRFQQNCFSSMEEQMILSGDVFGTMMAYKSRYPEQTYALFSTHDQKIYFAEIVDDTCQVRQLVYDQFEEDRIVELFGMSDWWAVYERMHLCPLKKEQMIQFYKQERLRYNGKFQELLAKVVRNSVQDLIATGNNRLVERVDDMLLVQEVGRDGKHQPTYRLSCTGKRLKDYQKIHSSLVRAGRCDLPEDDFIQNETPLSQNLAVQQKFKNSNLEKIQKTGIISFDIETVIVPVDQLSHNQLGNAAPIMLCVYGYAYADFNQASVIGGVQTFGDTRVQRIEVSQCFKGLDCVDQFVLWLIESGVLRMSPTDSEQGGNRPNHDDYLKDYQNIVIAHNGAKFDFRWLFDRVSKYAEVKIIGDLSHLKSFTVKNLNFVDTVQILPFSLKKLCKAVRTVKQKYPYDVEGVTYSNYQSKYEELEIYCMRDCECLHEAYVKYVTERASTYYNERGFIDKVFPISASSGAVDLFRQLYMDEDIKCYKEVYETLSPFYMGGITCAYSAYCQFGVSFDVNGSYNAAMHNLVPTEPVWEPIQRKFVRLYQTVVYSSRGESNFIESRYGQNFFSEGFRFKNTSCYKVTQFKYADDELHPSITQKTDGRLYHTLVSTGESWVWGVKLNYTLAEQKLAIEIGEMIEFKESHLFRKFVEDKSRMRKEAKREGNAVMDLIHKLDSNSVYGKMGQALNDKVFYGTKQQVEEFCVAKHVLDDSFKVTELKPVVSTRSEMYCVRYQTDRLSESQIGHMKHVASYITTLGHIYLFRMIHIVAKRFPADFARICYTDTDSTFVDVTKGFTLEDRERVIMLQNRGDVIAEQLEELTQLQQKIDDSQTLLINGLKQETGDDIERIRRFEQSGGRNQVNLLRDEMNDIYAQVRNIYQSNEIVSYLGDQMTVDAREMYAYQDPHYIGDKQVKIVDDSIPGSYKIEKFITEGIFLGSKMYAVKCFDVDAMTKLVKKCKMKGVREDKRVFDDYRRLYNSVFAQQYDDGEPDFRERITRGCIIQINQVQFRALDTGVRICNIVKYISPTLYKRRFKDSYGRQSLPFSSYNELLLFESQYKALYKLLREKIKTVLQDDVRRNMLSESAHYMESDRQIGRIVQDNFGEELKRSEQDAVEEEKRSFEEDRSLIQQLFQQDAVARPMVLSKITMHSDSFDKLVELILAKGYGYINQLLATILDQVIRVYNQSYYRVFIRDRFFDLKQARTTMLKLLYMHMFSQKILENNILFGDLLQYVDKCVLESYLPEEDREVRKRLPDELIKIVENQFIFFTEELFERVFEYVQARRVDTDHAEQFKKTGSIVSNQLEQVVQASHQNRVVKSLIANSLFVQEVRRNLEHKVRLFNEKMTLLQRADLKTRMEQHITHVKEVLQMYIDASNNDLERIAIDFRNYVRDNVSKRTCGSDSTRIRAVILFWRHMTGNERLLYDARWDVNRHWTGVSGPGTVITTAAKQFWQSIIPAEFDFKEEEDDDEDISMNQNLRRGIRRVVGDEEEQQEQ